MAGFGQEEASAEYGGEGGALIPNPSLFPAGPWVAGDYFPLPKPTAPAKGLFPLPKDPDTPCLERHSLPTPSQMIPHCASLITPHECGSDSCKDGNPHSSHHEDCHHPGLPLEGRFIGKPLALFLYHHSRWHVRAEQGQPVGGASDKPGIRATAPSPNSTDQGKQLPQQEASPALPAISGATTIRSHPTLSHPEEAAQENSPWLGVQDAGKADAPCSGSRSVFRVQLSSPAPQRQSHTGQPRFPGVASILKHPGSWATSSTAFHKLQENAADLGAAYPPTHQRAACHGLGPRCTQGSCLIQCG